MFAITQGNPVTSTAKLKQPVELSEDRCSRSNYLLGMLAGVRGCSLISFPQGAATEQD